MSFFHTPQNLKTYKDGSYRIVSDSKISVGDELLVDYNNNNKPFKKIVSEIIEERPSLGEFTGERPLSYKLRTHE